MKATVASEPLENINQIFTRMHAGDIEGRIVNWDPEMMKMVS